MFHNTECSFFCPYVREHVFSCCLIFFFIYEKHSDFDLNLLIRLINFYRGKNPAIKRLCNRAVSIIKPLKGADKNLKVNLESFFTMNYANYELLICVKDCNDPAVAIVKHLIEAYPNIDAHLIISESNITSQQGNNPKVNNMNPAYLQSKYDLVMISDDKVLIQPDALQEMVNTITSNKDVGIVSQLSSCYFKTPSCNKLLDCLIFLRLSLGPLLSFLLTPTTIISGVSTLYEKEIFLKCGGLKRFKNCPDEDIQILRYATKHGWKVKLSKFLCLQNSEGSGYSFQFNRLRRWMKFSTMDTDVMATFAFILTLVEIS